MVKDDQALKRNPGKIYRCQRYIPHLDILTSVPKTLFECWKGVPCALDPSNVKLFSAASWHQAQNTLKSEKILEFHYIIIWVWIKLDYTVIVLFGGQILLKKIFICHFEECLGYLMLLLALRCTSVQ